MDGLSGSIRPGLGLRVDLNVSQQVDRRLFGDLPDKPKALSWDGADKPLRLAAVPDCLPQRRNADCSGSILRQYGLSRPQRSNRPC